MNSSSVCRYWEMLSCFKKFASWKAFWAWMYVLSFLLLFSMQLASPKFRLFQSCRIWMSSQYGFRTSVFETSPVIFPFCLASDVALLEVSDLHCITTFWTLCISKECLPHSRIAPPNQSQPLKSIQCKRFKSDPAWTFLAIEHLVFWQLLSTWPPPDYICSRILNMDCGLSQALWATNKQLRNSDSQKPRHKTPPPKHGGNCFLAFNTERRHDSDGHGHFKTFDWMMMRAALLNLLSQLPWDQEFGIRKRASSEWLPLIGLAIALRVVQACLSFIAI